MTGDLLLATGAILAGFACLLGIHWLRWTARK